MKAVDVVVDSLFNNTNFTKQLLKLNIMITVHHLSEQNSVMNNFMKELRSSEIQQDSMRFRRNIERVGEIMAY